MGLRDRLNGFVQRHEVAWELTMGALALIWVALGFLIDEVGSGVRSDLELVEVALTGVFVLEFGSRSQLLTTDGDISAVIGSTHWPSRRRSVRSAS
jgi:hypothetical protein